MTMMARSLCRCTAPIGLLWPMLIAIVLGTTTTSRADDVVLVVDSTGRPVLEAEKALRAAGHQVEVVPTDRFSAAGRRTESSYLAAGPRAAQALAASALPHAAAFLVQDKAALSTLPTVRADVPLEQQARWMAAAFPGRTRVLILRDARASSIEQSTLEGAARAAGLSPSVLNVKAPGEVVAAFEAAVRAGGPPPFLWLIPDGGILTADTIPALLQTALQARIPVVGFASYFLRVGAMAAVSVDYGTMAVEALSLARSAATLPTGAAQRFVPGPSRSARLLVDGRLAGRMGIAVRAAPQVEVLR